MRSVLALALVLLALTLALNHSRALFGGPRENGELADRALEIVIGAKGALLPAARIGTGPERIGEAIRIGDRTLVAPCRSGLRAAFLGPDHALRAERCFDVAHSDEDARALRAALERARPGEALVLASSGRLEPSGEGAPRTELERALAPLGARAPVGSHTPESWALLAVRLERGWVPLAEGYSRESGVALAFVLSSDLESYAGFRGDLVLVRAGERREVFLEDELAHASVRTRGVALTRERGVLGRRLPGILLPPVEGPDGAAAPGRLAWRDVELDAGSGLLTWVGLADGESAGSDGVVLEVLVDGEPVRAGEIVTSGTPWRVQQLDLRSFAGRRVELELRAHPRQSRTGDALLLGRPVLVHGYDRPPLEAWAEER
jgi:hypothetical protein